MRLFKRILRKRLSHQRAEPFNLMINEMLKGLRMLEAGNIAWETLSRRTKEMLLNDYVDYLLKEYSVNQDVNPKMLVEDDIYLANTYRHELIDNLIFIYANGNRERKMESGYDWLQDKS